MNLLTRLTLATSLLAVVGASNVLARGDAAPKDCCSDLEARVKFLEDKAVVSDTKKVILSGHVNRAALWLDNGTKSNLAHVDNNNSASRLNLTGIASLNEDMALGGTFELELESNTSEANDVHSAQRNNDAVREVIISKAELFFKSQSFGKLTVGRGLMASDESMEATDFSGTRATANGASGAWRLAGGATFANKVTGRAASVNTIAEIFDSADGFANEGKHDRVRYDTPSYYGFSLGTSHGYQNTGDLWDVAAKFAGKFMGIKVAAQIAYVSDNSDDVSRRNLGGRSYAYDQVNGSVGVLFPCSMSGKEDTGISLYFGAANRDWDISSQDDGHVYAGKVGYTDRFFNIGNTSISGDLGYFKNMIIDETKATAANPATVANEPRGKSWGIFLVQNLDVVATEIYAGYRNYDFKLKNSAESFKDVHAGVVGARVKL